MKKVFYASLAVFIIALLFWGVYNLSFRKGDSDSTSASSQESQAKVDAIAPKNDYKEVVSAISDEPVIAPTMSSDGKSIKYYSAKNGRAYEIDEAGNGKKSISDKELIGLTGAFWSPDKAKVITKFASSEGKSKFYYYNYDTGSSSQLKDNIDRVAWQSTSNRIFYKYYNPQTQKRTLSVSNPDGSEWSDIADVPFRDLSIAQVPQSGQVSFWNKPDSFAATQFSIISLAGGESKIILKDLFGADYLWNANGTNALVSYVDSKGGHKLQLATVNANGGEFKNLNIPTFVSKCAWSKDDRFVYYALPGSVPDSSTLPNDYSDGKFNTTDTFWKVDLTTGEKDRLVDLDKMEKQFDASGLFMDPEESNLFFVNRLDGKLYRISL